MGERRAGSHDSLAPSRRRKRLVALALAFAGAAVVALLVDLVLALGDIETMAVFAGLFVIAAVCDPSGAFDDFL